MNPVAILQTSTFWQLFISISIKSGLVLALAGILIFLLKRSSASVRHFAWALAVTVTLLLPLFTFCLPKWFLPVLPEKIAVANSDGSDNLEGPIRIRYSPQIETDPYAIRNSAEKPSQDNSSVDLKRAAVAIWLIGAWIVLAQLLIGTVNLWLIIHGAEELRDGQWLSLIEKVSRQLNLQRPVKVVATDKIQIPITWGSRRPMVLLPLSALEWDRDQLQAVLMHEFAHIKRQDCLTQTMAMLACALYWFNPLIWIAARQMRKLREQACDDEVLINGTRPSSYATYLIDIAQTAKQSKFLSTVAVGMACSHLSERVQTILDPSVSRHKYSRRTKAMIIAVIISLLIPMASAQPIAPAKFDEKLFSTSSFTSQQESLDRKKEELMRRREALINQQREIQKQIEELEHKRQNPRIENQQSLEKKTRERLLEKKLELQAQEKEISESELMNFSEAARMSEVLEQASRKSQEKWERQLQEFDRAAEFQQKLERELVELGKKNAELKAEKLRKRMKAQSSEFERRQQEIEGEKSFQNNEFLKNEAKIKAEILQMEKELELQHQQFSERRSLEQQTQMELELRHQKNELETRLKELRRIYKDAHPSIIEIKERLKLIEQELKTLRK